MSALFIFEIFALIRLDCRGLGNTVYEDIYVYVVERVLCGRFWFGRKFPSYPHIRVLFLLHCRDGQSRLGSLLPAGYGHTYYFDPFPRFCLVLSSTADYWEFFTALDLIPRHPSARVHSTLVFL